MNILPQVEKVFQEIPFEQISIPDGFKNLYHYLDAFPHEKQKYSPLKEDVYFLRKYRNHIPQGWYGFSIGEPVPPEWNEIIDKILEICVQNDPDFEIHQIKMKFGGIRFYTFSEIIEDLHDVEVTIANRLFDKTLIW